MLNIPIKEENMDEELKQIELMMRGCHMGKRIMKFLKEEGYTLQSGSRSPDKAQIDPEKKTISLDTEDMKKNKNDLSYRPDAKERNVLSLIRAACLVKQYKFGQDFFPGNHISRTAPISNADIVATQCAFVNEMEEKSPKLPEIFDKHNLYYPAYKKALFHTEDIYAARAAAADSYFRHDALYETPDIAFRKKYIMDFDGTPYYTEPKNTMFNATVMSKMKQGGR